MIVRIEMDKKTEGNILLATITAVALECMLLTILWHFDQFPDSIICIVVLVFGFGPLAIIFIYWACKYRILAKLEI
jgi:hypothetical protein